MEQILSLTQNLGVVAVALIVQYFLAKQPQKWLAAILPAVYFGMSILAVVNVMQGGTPLIGGVGFTALLAFIMSNIITVMLFMVWWKREFDISTIVIAVIAVYILSNVAMMVLAMMASFFITF